MHRFLLITLIAVLLVSCMSSYPASGDRFSFHVYSEGNASNFELYSLVFKLNGKIEEPLYYTRPGNDVGYFDDYGHFFTPESGTNSENLREKTFTIAVYLKNESNDSLTFICSRNVDIDMFETIDWKVSVHFGSYDSLKYVSKELPWFRMENGKYVKYEHKNYYEFDWSKRDKIRSVYVESLKDSVFYYEELLGKNSGYFSKEKFTEIKD